MATALELIKQIRVVEFDWRETNQHDIGVIAEEVEKIIPEAVAKQDGQIIGINVLTLLSVVIKAIQELEKPHGN